MLNMGWRSPPGQAMHAPFFEFVSAHPKLNISSHVLTRQLPQPAQVLRHVGVLPPRAAKSTGSARLLRWGAVIRMSCMGYLLPKTVRRQYGSAAERLHTCTQPQ